MPAKLEPKQVRDAVAQAEVARRLGITQTTLSTWCVGKRQAALGVSGGKSVVFATFKTELVYQQRFVTREVARRAIFEHIEVFYNRIRRHASIGNVAPAEFERLSHAEQLAA